MEPGIAPLHKPSTEPNRTPQLNHQLAMFEIEGKVYCELRCGFEKWSDAPFPAMFAIKEDEMGEGGRVGSDETESYIRLSGCTQEEFEALLKVMYSPDGPSVVLNKNDWFSVLKLSRLWDMPQLALMAVDKLSVNLTPLEKITLGKASAHGVGRWIREGFTSIIEDMNRMTLEEVAVDLGWEMTARVLWMMKRVSGELHPSLEKLGVKSVVDKIVEEEMGGDDWEIEAGLRAPYLEAFTESPHSITITQDQPVPRRAGTASIITFAPDGVYISRTYTQTPTRVLQDFSSDTGWRTDKHVRLVGDTTGCGRSDIIAFGDAGVYVSRNRADGTFAPAQLVLRDFGYEDGWRVAKHLRYVVDLRGKGFVDILGFGDEGVYVALNNNGDGTFAPPKVVLQDFGSNAGGWNLERHLRFLADVTGNGLPDIIAFGETGVHVALNNGDGTFQTPKLAIRNFAPRAGRWSIPKHPRTVADLTGSGRVDIIGFFDDGVHVALNAGNGTFHPAKLVLKAFGYSKGWRVKTHPRFVADITGMKRGGDIVGFGDSCASIAVNNGDGTFAPTMIFLKYTKGSERRFVVDLTGNGGADVLGFAEDGVWAAVNDGRGRFGLVRKVAEPFVGGGEGDVCWVTNLYS